MKFKIERASGKKIDYPGVVAGEIEWVELVNLVYAQEMERRDVAAVKNIFSYFTKVAQDEYQFCDIQPDKILAGMSEYTIEINMLEELAQLQTDMGNPIIIDGDTLKIYDNWIE